MPSDVVSYHLLGRSLHTDYSILSDSENLQDPQWVCLVSREYSFLLGSSDISMGPCLPTFLICISHSGEGIEIFWKKNIFAALSLTS
jgi:hypothetical protein